MKLKGKKDKDNRNELDLFIKKANRFIENYEDLNLIKKSQKKILIYLYDNCMLFEPEEENEEIKNSYNEVKKGDNFELYIRIFSAFLKIMNEHERIKIYDNLKTNQKNLQAEVTDLKEQMKKKDKDINELREMIIKFNEKINSKNNNSQEASKANNNGQANTNVVENNEKDNKERVKKNSLNSAERTNANIIK